MTNEAKQESALAKGQRFTAIDSRGRGVKGVCLDVMPWAKWPLRCDVEVSGVRHIQLYSAAELHNLEVHAVMAHVKVERTLHGNVNIVLDWTSALKLARILNWSEFIGDGECALSEQAAFECEACDVEEFSWSLHGELLRVGVDHEDL